MFKKLILLSIIIFLTGAGCATVEEGVLKNNVVSKTKVPNEAINNILAGGKSKTENNNITNTTMTEKENTPNNEQTNRHLANQKDLAQEYSQAILKTNKGNIKVVFNSEDSPITVNNFLNLAQQGFYNGTSFHRVISGFMIQGGDPNSKDQTNRAIHGMGGPNYKFDDEFNNKPLVKGSLAMANSGPNTNGSQFFIVTAASTPWLDGKHVNLGTVVEGMEVVDAIEAVETDARDNPINSVIIESIELIQ